MERLRLGFLLEPRAVSAFLLVIYNVELTRHALQVNWPFDEICSAILSYAPPSVSYVYLEYLLEPTASQEENSTGLDMPHFIDWEALAAAFSKPRPHWLEIDFTIIWEVSRDGWRGISPPEREAAYVIRAENWLQKQFDESTKSLAVVDASASITFRLRMTPLVHDSESNEDHQDIVFDMNEDGVTRR